MPGALALPIGLRPYCSTWTIRASTVSSPFLKLINAHDLRHCLGLVSRQNLIDIQENFYFASDLCNAQNMVDSDILTEIRRRFNIPRRNSKYFRNAIHYDTGEHRPSGGLKLYHHDATALRLFHLRQAQFAS